MEYLQKVLNKLLNADISDINSEFIVYCSNEAMRLLNKEPLDEYDIACMNIIIQISQILYNNTDRSLLPLDDGVYDLLLEKDKRYNSSVQVGAMPIKFSADGEIIQNSDIINPLVMMDDPEGYFDKELYYEDIGYPSGIYPELLDQPIDRTQPPMGVKKNLSVPHSYPNLVGTLDKCKFTLNKEARDRGVFEDKDVKIFERDFLGKHLAMGLFGPDDEIELCLELKYDGVSVEADVTDHIISARSRGDTNADIAADLTPIFGGYKFPFCPEIKEQFGMKFEAIMTHINLDKMSRLRGRPYKNARNGVIGLLGALDANNYRDLITLVPLATSLDLDRKTEIEFMNSYYHSGEKLRYSIVKGTYNKVLYMVYKFVEEAQQIRPIMPFMYDGVVISYTDLAIIEKLGRKNSTNQYSVAIKFNPMVRQAVFTGYSYTIGQNGIITPMLHYTPVEFYGGIHTKSSAHSYARFKELNLAIGDVVQIEYVNDVMPYVTRCDNQPVWGSHNPPEEFPTVCPCCGTRLEFTDKSAFCPNDKCEERVISRMTNMMKKLNLKDFAEESLRAIHISSLNELFNADIDYISSILGSVNASKFIARVEELKTNPIEDYKIVGSLGFTDIAQETWKKILSKMPLERIVYTDENLYYDLVQIKGIGPSTAETISTEANAFHDDLITILSMPNVIRTYGIVFSGKRIRFTGVRDQELCDYLNSLGMDANGNAGVTKDTDILIVPYEGFTSSKTAKAGPNTIIVGINTFKSNIESYIK